jgi:tetratricopeptide (TPR) repeat protein
MAISSILQRFGSVMSALPSQVFGMLSLGQVRNALQSGTPEKAAEAARKGIADIDRRRRSPEGDLIADAFRAGIVAGLATALHRLGQDSEKADEACREAEERFDTLMQTNTSLLEVVLPDYIIMLAEFGNTKKGVSVLQSPAGQKIPSTAYAALGRSLAAKNDPGALEFLRTAAALAPTPRNLSDLAAALLSGGDRDAAFQQYLRSAAMAMQLSDLETALNAAEKGLEVRPGDHDALRVRGTIRWRARDYAGAVGDLRTALAAEEDDVETRVALIRALLDLGRPEEALDHLAIAAKALPQSGSDLPWLRGDAELAIGDRAAIQSGESAARPHWEEAVRNLQQAVDERRENGAARRSLALAKHRLGRSEEALEELVKVLDQDPDDVRAHAYRAEILLQKGRSSDALKTVNVALALLSGINVSPSERARLLGLKGLALLAEGWREDAISTLRESIDIQVTVPAIARGLVSALRAKGDWRGLAELAGRMQTEWKSVPSLVQEFWREEVNASRKAGDYPRALAILIYPPLPADDPDVVWLRARLYADIGDFETAHAIMDAIRDTKANPQDQLSLCGWIVQNLEPEDQAERRKLGEQGRDLYERALSALPGRPGTNTSEVWLRKGLANALMRIPDQEKSSEREYWTVIRLSEESLNSSISIRGLSLIGWCYFCVGEYDTALGCYRSALKTGQMDVPAEFDFALVSTISEALEPSDKPTSRERLDSALASVRKENVLRQCGLLRVALHDVREMVFRKPELRTSKQIAQMRGAMIAELSTVADKIGAEHKELREHISRFLGLAMVDLQQVAT